MESQNMFRKTMLASLGVYSLTREKAQDLMTDLVKRGELSKDEGSKFVKAMLERADEEVTHLKKLVDKRVGEAVSKIGPSYDKEFKKLNQKIDKLSKQVEKLTK